MDMILYQCKILHLHPIKFKHFIFYFLFNLYIYEFLAAHLKKIPSSTTARYGFNSWWLCIFCCFLVFFVKESIFGDKTLSQTISNDIFLNKVNIYAKNAQFLFILF
jgi:hypothetical protein